MAHQRLEHGKFTRGQGQVIAVFLQGAQAHVKREGAKRDDFLVQRRRTGHFRDRAAAQYGVNARQQLARVEGLGQIIVRTDFQAHDTVHVFAFGGQHDDGRTVIGGSQAAAYRQAVFARHHQVQHDQVYRVAQHDAVERLAVFRKNDFKTLLRQVAAKQITDAGIVVKNEDFVGTGVGCGLVHSGSVICNRPILRCESASCGFIQSL